MLMRCGLYYCAGMREYDSVPCDLTKILSWFQLLLGVTRLAGSPDGSWCEIGTARVVLQARIVHNH